MKGNDMERIMDSRWKNERNEWINEENYERSKNGWGETNQERENKIWYRRKPEGMVKEK